jgi:UDP-N-acetyl-D-glucosamine dehydrogenase
VRESPALDIIHLLREKGANVSYHDPYVASVHYEGIDLTCVPNLDTALSRSDCVIIVTDHSNYDWADISKKAKLLVDTRRVIRED